MSCSVVIPAYKPSQDMIPFVKALVKAGIGDVIAVDDGSGAQYHAIFKEIERTPGCTVLRHGQNKGKGAAIKTAICHYMQQKKGHVGIITADCDGQHSVKDIAAVHKAMCQQQDSLILGTREFGKETPQRSAMGNRATAGAMRLLYNIRLKDTQTGLRGIPNFMHQALATMNGDRYEYELNMLIHAKKHCVPYTLVKIDTIYFDNNAGSHYRTVRDSVRLVSQMLRGVVQYGFSTLLSGIIDVLVFTLLVKLVLGGFPAAERLFYATVCARILSSIVNYSCNRHLPYVQNTKVLPTMVKYYILWLCQVAISYTVVWVLYTYAGFGELWAKLMIDALLGIVSYQIQMRWVFHKAGEVQCRIYRDEETVEQIVN